MSVASLGVIGRASSDGDKRLTDYESPFPFLGAGFQLNFMWRNIAVSRIEIMNSVSNSMSEISFIPIMGLLSLIGLAVSATGLLFRQLRRKSLLFMITLLCFFVSTFIWPETISVMRASSTNSAAVDILSNGMATRISLTSGLLRENLVHTFSTPTAVHSNSDVTITTAQNGTSSSVNPSWADPYVWQGRSANLSRVVLSRP